MKPRVIKDRYLRPRATEAAVRLRPVFEDFHVLRMEGDYEYPRHRHANYEVILVDHGPYRAELNGAELELNRGEALFIQPGDWHQDHLRNRQKHYVIHFRLEAAAAGQAAPQLFAADTPAAAQVVSGNHLANASLLRELRREAQTGSAHGGAIQDSLLEAFFWRLIRRLKPAAFSTGFRRLPQDEAAREHLLRSVEELSSRPAAIGELARRLRISVRSLHSLSRRAAGCSPARLLLEARIRRAEELIRQEGLSSKEASDRLGFANPFHFSRAFRRVRGVSPSRLL